MTRFATLLLDHVARVMPSKHRAWVQAMRVELDHVPTTAEAIVFALGCVQASYAQRLRDVLEPLQLARWILAGCALACAGGYLLATALVVGIKASPALTPRDLGSGPGTAEALLFFQTYSPLKLATFPVVALLLAMGGILLARRRPGASSLLNLAAAGALLVAVSDLGGDWPLAWSNGWFIPLACLAPVWWLSRRAPDLSPR